MQLSVSVKEQEQRHQGAPGQQDLQHQVRPQPARQLPCHPHASHDTLHLRPLDRV